MIRWSITWISPDAPRVETSFSEQILQYYTRPNLFHDKQSYPGKHELLVTLAQFERTQELLGKVDRARSKRHIFAYTGLMQCGACGGSVTAERKTNRYGTCYAYYHCTHKKANNPCREKWVEEGQLEEQVLVFLRSIYLSQKEPEEAFGTVEEERKKEHLSDYGIKQSLNKL